MRLLTFQIFADLQFDNACYRTNIVYLVLRANR